MSVTIDEVMQNVESLLMELGIGGVAPLPADAASISEVVSMENVVRTYIDANLIPTGGIMLGMFAVACPRGWTRVSAADDKILRGKAAYGGTGGAATHTHSVGGVVAHTHGAGTFVSGSSGSHGSHSYTAPSGSAGPGTQSSPSVTIRRVPGTGTMSGGVSHEHNDVMTGTTSSAGAGDGTSGSGSNLPPYLDVIVCSKD